MSKKKIATVWLDGCSGCHMSFLDMDERLLALAGAADLVYSPLVDAKEFPPDVDLTLVEGAVSSEEDLHKIKMIRERTKILVSLGDCAVTANAPGMRNPFGTKAVYDRAYRENVTFDPGIPDQVVPYSIQWNLGGDPGFLLQFFVSPFQFFIVAPWGLAVFALATGSMPQKSGGRIEEAKAPAEYRRAVTFCVAAGAVGFVVDWIVSWMVVSRP